MNPWTSHMSKTYLREYWHNKETGKSVWTKPQEVLDCETEKEKRKQKYLEQMRVFDEQMAEREKARVEREKKETKSHGMQIVNGNGMSWTIEGGAHWTKDDYLEELRNYNQSLRDF